MNPTIRNCLSIISLPWRSGLQPSACLNRPRDIPVEAFIYRPKCCALRKPKFLGLVCTAIGSAWYHRDPTDSTLFWDRLPMTLVFEGVLGCAIAQRVGSDVGRLSLALLVPLGIACVVYWRMTGDLSLYLALQLGGIGGLLLLILLARKGDDSIPWERVVAWYALAKVAESTDQAIWDLTDGVIAGHTLKRLLAAAAGAAALWPLGARRCPLGNEPQRHAPLLVSILNLRGPQRVGEQRRNRHGTDTSRHWSDPRCTLGCRGKVDVP